MAEKSDIEKLRILLDHWIEHNHSHEEEMDKWQQIASQNNHKEAAEQIAKAISAMKETDKALAKALETLGGKVHSHDHHHHH